MSKRRLNLGSLVEKAVLESLEETVGQLFESEASMQSKATDALKPFRHEQDRELSREAEDDPVQAVADDETTMDIEDGEVELKVLSVEEMNDISVNTVIDEINKMRSGESLKDADIREQLSSYFDVLNVPERKMLFSYLQGLAQIMSQGASGTDAARPGIYKLRASEVKPENTGDVPKKSGNNMGTKQSKEKKPAPMGVPSDPGAPAPIVVGERADKRREKRKLRELMRR